MTALISRAEAMALGLKRYFTGKCCPRGHICERMCSSHDCMNCAASRATRWQRQNPQRSAANNHRYKQLNRTKVNEEKRAYAKLNRGKLTRKYNAWCARNRNKVRLRNREQKFFHIVCGTKVSQVDPNLRRAIQEVIALQASFFDFQRSINDRRRKNHEGHRQAAQSHVGALGQRTKGKSKRPRSARSNLDR